MWRSPPAWPRSRGASFYAGCRTIPDHEQHPTSSSSTSPTRTTQQVVIPDTQAGTYYILLQGDTGSGTGQPFTLSANTLPLLVTSASPAQAGSSGTTTLTIQGAEFTAGTTVSLVPHPGGGPADHRGPGDRSQSSTTLSRPVQPGGSGRRGASMTLSSTSGA